MRSSMCHHTTLYSVHVLMEIFRCCRQTDQLPWDREVEQQLPDLDGHPLLLQPMQTDPTLTIQQSNCNPRLCPVQSCILSAQLWGSWFHRFLGVHYGGLSPVLWIATLLDNLDLPGFSSLCYARQVWFLSTYRLLRNDGWIISVGLSPDHDLAPHEHVHFIAEQIPGPRQRGRISEAGRLQGHRPFPWNIQNISPRNFRPTNNVW